MGASCGLPKQVFGRWSAGPLVHDIRQVSDGPIEEEGIVHVRTATVVCANYGAIVHDFPQVFGSEARRRAPLAGCPDCTAADRLCPQAIDAWLIRNSAFVSERQAQPNAVNSTVDHVDAVRPGYRPPGYGRAMVVPIEEGAAEGQAGFLDLKGVGVSISRTPSHDPYSSGLEYLGYALADFFYGWLVDTIFARTCPGYHVLPVYAVIDLGFDVVDGWHGTAPAGLHVRRAHARPQPTSNLPTQGEDREKLLLHAELLLRTFGLSSTSHGTAFRLSDEAPSGLVYSGRPVETTTDGERAKVAEIVKIIRDGGGTRLEIMNVQATSACNWENKALEMFDFGQMGAFRDFWNPVGNLIRNIPLAVGRVLSPQHPAFVRPDPRYAVDPDLCGRHAVNAFSLYAAQRFRAGEYGFDRAGIEALLRIARLKAFRRDTGWAHRRIAAARDRGVARGA